MKNKILILLVLFAFVSMNYGQLDRSKRPQPGPAPVINLGNYDSFTLANGLKVFVVENHKLPKVSFNLIVDRDPLNEKDKAGYIDMAGQLLRTGTKTRTKDKIDQEVDFIGASLSTSSTGVSGSSLKKHINKLLDIMSDVVLNPQFKQEELDKIKKQTLSGLASQKDDPSAIASNVATVLTFGKDHPYGELTTEATVKNITLDDLKGYYSTYFKPNISYLAIVGDIKKDEAKKLVEKYFGKWKKGEVAKNTFTAPSQPLLAKVAMVDRPASVQSVINITYPIDLKIGSPDVVKANVMNTILGGGFQSKINNNLREVHGYTYGAGSSIDADKYAGKFSVSTTVRNSVTDSAITEILNEMRKMRSEKITAEELQSTKNYITGGFARSLENPQTIANFAINIERYGLSKDYYKNFLTRLSEVTVDDVQEVAKKYVKPNNAYILVVGNADEVAKTLTNFTINNKVNYYDIYGNEVDPAAQNLPAGVTIESVLDKYTQAVGGKENLLKIKDKTMKLSASIQGMNLTITISQKAPNKLYQNLDAGVFQQMTVFDGEKGKVSAMGQEQPIEGSALEEIKVQAAIHGHLDYPALGVKPELSGMEKINGKDAYKVTLNYPSGSKATQYYDVESGFLVRSTSTVNSPQGTFTQTSDFGDYKEVEGIKFPFKMHQSVGPQDIELTVDSIEINTGLQDSLFEVK